MLYLIGFGINGLKGLSIEGLEVIRRADLVCMETYTSPVEVNDREIERLIGRSVIRLSREDLEEGTWIVDRSASEDVALLTPGDPLTATTHISILTEAKRKGISVKVIHAPSIITAAIGEAGLHIYKLGRVVTMAKLLGSLPFSVYEAIKDSKARGLHTLILLQQSDHSAEIITPREALEILLRMEGERKEGVVSCNDLVIVMGRLGFHNEVKIAGSLANLIRLHEVVLEAYPSVLIVPGKLHFAEIEGMRAMLTFVGER